MNYIKQITAEMRQQPLIGIITLSGTALAIFLIMVVVMLQEMEVTPIAPESNRDRFLHARFFHREDINDPNGFGSSSTMSYYAAQRLYCNLESAEATGCTSASPMDAHVNVHGKTPMTVDFRCADSNFWKVFDFTFLHGNPFTDSDTDLRKAIVTESVARTLFGTTDAVGRRFNINYYNPYTVAAVVKDVPTVTSTAYAQVWIPFSQEEKERKTYMGGVHATILARDKADFPAIRNEINRRVEALNSEMKADGSRMADHEAPYPQEAIPHLRYSNITPDYQTPQRQRWIIYAILILIPAINLSSMTQSRLRKRVSEIGVRRAFGCTRSRLVGNILTENFIITLAGGIIGFIAGVLFIWLAFDLLYNDYGLANTHSGINPMMFVNLDVLLLAIGFCFILNLLSSAIPAWRAVRISPVEAIGGLHK